MLFAHCHFHFASERERVKELMVLLSSLTLPTQKQSENGYMQPADGW